MDLIGKQILSYRIERLIGEGGMGNVYLAVHTHIGRKVAIKALNPSLARNPEIRERFKNEASMLSQLHHPNIVALYDYVELDIGVFLVMEYAEGQPLDDYIEKVTGPIPEERAIPLFNQILEGVAYAHQKSVVHRDIKPSNIIVNPEGKAKILDFGIAKIIGDTNHKLTKTGTKLGTVLYMSPEQVKGDDVDYRTDIYSLGITLFEMLTGKCPYDTNSTEYEVYKKIVEEALPDAKQYYPGISDRMIGVINKATEKLQADRFQSCQEFKLFVTGDQALDSSYKQKVQPALRTFNQKEPGPAKVPGRTLRRSVLFWNIFMPVFLTAAVILTVFKLINVNEERFVIAWKLYLRNSKNMSDNSNTLKTYDFGEKLSIIDIDRTSDDQGYKWAKVRDEKGKEGYIVINFLGSEKEYKQIKLIFGQESQKQTNVVFKKALRSYFLNQDYFDGDEKSDWHIGPDTPGSDFKSYTYGDFNNDGVTDYACTLENSVAGRYSLVIFFGQGENDASLAHSEELKAAVRLRTMVKGEKIFTGRVRTDYERDALGNLYQVQKKIYDAIAFDGLIAKYTKTGKRYLYIFDKNANRFTQTFELK